MTTEIFNEFVKSGQALDPEEIHNFMDKIELSSESKTRNMKKLIMALMLMATFVVAQSKTLVVYYSHTNNVHRIIIELSSQIEADVVRVEPAEKGLDYAANNYAIGSALIAAIRNNPDNPGSYPAIDPVDVNPEEYDTIIIGAPLWWSNIAAPMQTFLFQHGEEMAGKNIGLIVSSASSGISGVESDGRRLVPDGKFLAPSLWIRSSQTSNASKLIADWLEEINYSTLNTPDMTNNQITIKVGENATLTATLDDNSSANALMELLAVGPVTIDMRDYGNMEKVGSLPETLPRNDTYFTTHPGDLVLYLGNQFVIYYDNNSYNFTRLGRINGDYTGAALKSILGDGNVTVTLSTSNSSRIDDITADISEQDGELYTLSGHRAPARENLPKGVYIVRYTKDNMIQTKKILL